jgi:molybdate transport system ATP-binding protein
MTLTLEQVTLPLAHFTLDVSFVTTGASTALYGPSGAGKTTILELIAGLRQPSSGEIFLDGEPLVRRPARQRHVGYVTQDDTLFPHLSVRNNVLYGATNSLDRVASVLEITHLLDRGIRHLSGGERKRVALARALVSAPRILLLDEPLTGVDTELRRRVLDYLVRVREEFPIPIVYVTHEIEEAMTLCDEVVRIDRGRVVRGDKSSPWS